MKDKRNIVSLNYAQREKNNEGTLCVWRVLIGLNVRVNRCWRNWTICQKDYRGADPYAMKR
ncbi:hypothetical protein KCP70_00195 [Salmonella enterica subsp. enterica]|nr:hypothetical protein KCP70_00195 [Salmonella enterica subsp. enterica]